MPRSTRASVAETDAASRGTATSAGVRGRGSVDGGALGGDAAPSLEAGVRAARVVPVVSPSPAPWHAVADAATTTSAANARRMTSDAVAVGVQVQGVRA